MLTEEELSDYEEWIIAEIGSLNRPAKQIRDPAVARLCSLLTAYRALADEYQALRLASFKFVSEQEARDQFKMYKEQLRAFQLSHKEPS